MPKKLKLEDLQVQSFVNQYSVQLGDGPDERSCRHPAYSAHTYYPRNNRVH